jgi:hypothetical protein
MRRDFIIIVGNQGFGKSAWSRTYGRTKPRVLEFNPKGDTPRIDYVADPHDYIPEIMEGKRAAFRFGTWLTEDIPTFTNAAFFAGKTTLIFEECAMLFDKGMDLPQWLRRPVFMGREPELNFVLVAQRANSIPLDVRSQANRIVTFLQTDPADVRAVSERIGAEFREEIPRLTELECFDWQPGQGVQRYRIPFPPP